MANEVLYSPAGKRVQVGTPTERTRLLARGYTRKPPKTAQQPARPAPRPAPPAAAADKPKGDPA